MRKPDEIMAEYLLKGGKMLAKTCQDCGSPLFEYKGETFCGVCREAEQSAKAEQKADQNSKTKTVIAGSEKRIALNRSQTAINLDEQFDHTIRSLLTRIEDETDTPKLTKLSRSLLEVAEAYAVMNQGYDNRDNS